MADISLIAPPTEREIFYFRQRYKNRVFQAVIAYFANQAERTGLNKRTLAARLGKDPAQITRWFAEPSNWTLDTISDLLLAMQAEMSDEVISLETPAVTKNLNQAVRFGTKSLQSASLTSTTPLAAYGR